MQTAQELRHLIHRYRDALKDGRSVQMVIFMLEAMYEAQQQLKALEAVAARESTAAAGATGAAMMARLAGLDIADRLGDASYGDEADFTRPREQRRLH